jgi:hypothetical protein
MCGRDDTTGRWWCSYYWDVDARALRRLGLHPDQPLSHLRSPVHPSWWLKKVMAERPAPDAGRAGKSAG